MYFHRLSKSCVPANQIIGENCRVKRETCSWGAKVNAIRMLNVGILEQNLDLAKHKNNIILSSINNSHFKT